MSSNQQIRIYIDQDQIIQEIQKLNRQIRQLANEIDKLRKEISFSYENQSDDIRF